MTTDDVDSTLRDFRRLIDRLMQGMPDEGSGPRLLDIVEAHLGVPPDGLAVTSEDVPQHRLVDADIAMAQIAGRDPEHRIVGLGGGDMRHHLTLGDHLQHARMGQGGVLAQVDYDQKATGPGPEDHRNVVALGLWLFRYRGRPVVVRQQSAKPQMMRPAGSLDVLAVDPADAEALVAEVRTLMDEHSVFRGQVVTFSRDPYGRGLAGVTFLERPQLHADDVVLPEGLLARVSLHVLGIAEHRDARHREDPHHALSAERQPGEVLTVGAQRVAAS